jgi:DNA transformation protein
MVVANAWVAHCTELLSGQGRARARRMFGGHGFYIDDLFVGLLAGDALYLKADTQARPAFEAAGCQPFVFTKKNGSQVVLTFWWSAPADAMESPALMAPWARLALASALRAANAKRPAKARKPAAAARKTASRAPRRKPAA